MSQKRITRFFLLIVILTAAFAVPAETQAGGICGGVYVVSAGETLESIAATCGTSVAAILAANPGIGTTLYSGQLLTLPGSNYPIPIDDCNCPPITINTYVVQYGDTFSGIAKRFGVTINELWSANPGIANINLLYVGQVLYIPKSGLVIEPVREPLIPRSYGTVPASTPHGKVRLSNKAKTEVYVSLQGTTTDGFHVINEYPVGSMFDVKVPAGWYIYVAWVGGRKFEGQFNLRGDSHVFMTFYRDKVVVE
ncbi:MAG: LysM peptidoglycan-binding domain-containing protein [Chloroflexi bacterium]|nr:LysM peptidoglycan-binding domain-containing protein [Chloroflexota bacterium]